MSATIDLRPGATERGYCQPERRETAWLWVGTQNHSTPEAISWRCMTSSCSRVRIALADLPDAEGFVHRHLVIHIRKSGTKIFDDSRSGDYEELLQDGWMRLMDLYAKWDPSRGITFRSYASQWLPRRLNEWNRERFGRDGNKPLNYAVSLDHPLERDDNSDDAVYSSVGGGGSVGSAISGGDGDPASCSSPALARALLRRDRDTERARRALGIRSRPRVQRRNQEA